MCGMLLGTGLERAWHHARCHRLFSTARWSADEVGLALAGLVVARLLPDGAPLQVAVDDTLFKRSGKEGVRRCLAARRRRERATPGRLQELPGHRRHRGDRAVPHPGRCACRSWPAYGAPGTPERSPRPAR
ncbi:transposase [Streptomyces lonegramiae]|uniref:transposase n=1 Tax=Streptomyces lonegramiae TaxID=3075524 RepID=UPI00374E03CF